MSTLVCDPADAPIVLDAASFPKRCNACGLTYDLAGWLALPMIGHLDSADEAGNACTCEMRNCPCTGTFSVQVVAMDPAAWVARANVAEVELGDADRKIAALERDIVRKSTQLSAAEARIAELEERIKGLNETATQSWERECELRKALRERAA